MEEKYCKIINPYRLTVISRTWCTFEGEISGRESMIFDLVKAKVLLCEGRNYSEQFDAMSTAGDVEQFIKEVNV